MFNNWILVNEERVEVSEDGKTVDVFLPQKSGEILIIQVPITAIIAALNEYIQYEN